MLEQWTLYRRASEEINGYLMEGRYSVSRLCLLNGSLEAVQQQVESLEVRRVENRLPSLFWKGEHIECVKKSFESHYEREHIKKRQLR